MNNFSSESIAYAESKAALFLTTPTLLSQLAILLNDSGLTADTFFFNQSERLYANAEKVYFKKNSKMSENIFTNLFRHAEKVRIQNHVQEKMLNEKVNGHKGIEKKLQLVLFFGP